MSRNARRIALSLGTAAGAALIAASISMGTAPAARADITDADPVSDLIGAFDPNSFSATGAPTDALGLFGYYTDTYLLGPSGLGDALDPSVDSYVSSLPSGAASVLDADPVSDLVGALDPSAFTALGVPDDVLGVLASGLDADLLAPLGLGALLDPVIDGLVGSATAF
jgi:hypothetical protein